MPRGWSAEWRTSLPSCRVLSSRTRAPLGAPSRLRAPGFRLRHRPRVRASWDEACANPSPASSSRRGPNAPRSVPGPPGSGGYVRPRPRAPHQPTVSRRSFEARRRISGASPHRGSIIETSREDALSRARREEGCKVNVAEIWNLFLHIHKPVIAGQKAPTGPREARPNDRLRAVFTALDLAIHLAKIASASCYASGLTFIRLLVYWYDRSG